MERRVLLSSAFAASLAPAFRVSAAEAPASPGWRRFEITLLDSPGAAQLWLPLAQTADGYQAARGPETRGNGPPDCLDPERFRYEITSRDVTVS